MNAPARLPKAPSAPKALSRFDDDFEFPLPAERLASAAHQRTMAMLEALPPKHTEADIAAVRARADAAVMGLIEEML